VSADPIVTFSKRSTGVPLGIPSARPEVFRDRKALHLIGLSHTIERENDAERLAADFETLSRTLPHSRFVVTTNSEVEAYLLSALGVPSMMASQLIFLNDKVFCPRQANARFDAIYNARLVPMKHHELARGIESLGLLYDLGPPEEPLQYDKTRELLPQATFINHELGNGAYRQLKIDDCAEQLNTARVGIILSAVEGSSQASLEYLLCGLPVVSTHSIGGRDRYYMPPFCRVVEPDADQVAAAVRALAGARIPKQVVRNHIMHLLTFDRHNFLIAVNRLVKETFGIDDHFKSFAPFEIGLTRWRRADDAIAPLAAA
jgi:hypothetical protein